MFGTIPEKMEEWILTLDIKIMFNIPVTKYLTTPTIVVFVTLNTQTNARATEVASNQICNSEGAFGIHFGDSFPGTRVQADNFLFGRGCYLIKPPFTLEYFDTYAACISELDGKIYQIQASKTFDTKSDPVNLTLHPEQIEANRELGQKALNGVLGQLPTELSEKAYVKEKSWKVEINDHVSLEVDNATGWAIGFNCMNEVVAGQLFKERIWGH